MGRKSREKKERTSMGLTGKQLNDMRKKSATELYPRIDGKGEILLNPLKKMVKGKAYKDPTGLQTLINTINQNKAYLNQQKEKNTSKEEK